MKLPYLLVLGCICMISGCATMSGHEKTVRRLVAQELNEYIDREWNEKIAPVCEGGQLSKEAFKAALTERIVK